jgi:hypothetical protein
MINCATDRSYPLAKGKFFTSCREINLNVAEGEFVSMGPFRHHRSVVIQRFLTGIRMAYADQRMFVRSTSTQLIHLA